MRPIWTELRQPGTGAVAVANESRFTRLDPVTSSHYGFLFELALQAGSSWSWHGRPPSMEHFVDVLWHGVTDQAVVTARSAGPMALVGLYGHNLAQRTAYVRLYVSELYQRHGWPLEGALLFIDRCMMRYDLRVLYAETTAEKLSSLGAAFGTLFQREGVLRDGVLVDGVPTDVHIGALHCDDWKQRRESLVGSVARSRE